MSRHPTSVPSAQKRILEAALDQRNPSPELVRALNTYLTLTDHLLALKVEGTAQ